MSGVYRASSVDGPGPLAAFALHDAKNLACAIGATVEWLQRTLPPELRRGVTGEALDDLGTLSSHLGALLVESLHEHRRGSHSLPLRLDEACLAAVADEAVRRVRRTADGLGVTVLLSGAHEARGRLDSALVGRVLDNLLDNALRFAPAGSEVEVVVSAQDGHLSVSVSDQGPGVPHRDRDRIFDLFVSAERPGGAGLGLAFARRVARAHAGDLYVDDTERGARFVLQLPAALTPPELAPTLQRIP